MTEKTTKRIALFGGTTEGRLLAEAAASLELSLDIFVATEYGKEGLPDGECIRCFCGRLDDRQIEKVLRCGEYDLVIDATHPYAKLVSENIRNACAECGLRLLRVLRKQDAPSGTDHTVLVDTVEEAVEFLKHTDGAVLVTTGSKELAEFKELPGWEERIYARVLSVPDVVTRCGELGFYGRHLIAMQGPFSAELNAAILKEIHARWMVTKESGNAGGFREKEEAAQKAGVGLVVIGRPEEQGSTLEEAVRELERTAGREIRTDLQKPRRIRLIGAGPGDPGLLTVKAKELLEKCQLVAGAGRVVRSLSLSDKPMLFEYEPEKIVKYLDEHPEYTDICVVYSGDTGFYSGARGLVKLLENTPGTEVSVIPGISSLNSFFASLASSWEDARLISLHGRDCNLVQAVRENHKVFALSGGQDTLGEVCRRLLTAGLDHVTLTVGEDLSLGSQRVFSGSPAELLDRKTEALSVILIENPDGVEIPVCGLPDEAFIRDRVPMTKREIRAVSVSMLELTRDAVVYDVGAGTGSVSIECARLSDSIKVYAIEKNPDAAALLEKNREKFDLRNMEIIQGEAPEAMGELPAPTHVFIGGSGGKLEAVVRAALKKNPYARFVINMITMESVASAIQIEKSGIVKKLEITQISAARAKKVGSSNMMMGMNPVWIMAFQGAGTGDVPEIGCQHE